MNKGFRNWLNEQELTFIERQRIISDAYGKRMRRLPKRVRNKIKRIKTNYINRREKHG